MDESKVQEIWKKLKDVVSSTGFYNDRKIIRYADGTIEYPTLEAIPFHQTEERARAYRRLLQELERTGKPNYVPLHLRPELSHHPNEDRTSREDEDSDSLSYNSCYSRSELSTSRSRRRHNGTNRNIFDGEKLIRASRSKIHDCRGDYDVHYDDDDEDEDERTESCIRSCNNFLHLILPRRNELNKMKKNRRVQHHSKEEELGPYRRLPEGTQEKIEMTQFAVHTNEYSQ